MNIKDCPCQEASIHSREHFIPCGRPGYTFVFHHKDRRVYIMCDQCSYHNLKNRGGIELIVVEKEDDHEFIFTNSNNSSNDMPARRRSHPNVLQDRWVKCHIIGDRIHLGDIVCDT